MARQRPRLVFTHIPKCAGTSIDAALRAKVGSPGQPRIKGTAARKAGQLVIGQRDPVELLKTNASYLQYLLCYHLNLNWTLVSGHLPVNGDILNHYRETHQFVTLLRQPEQRWVSHYLFNKMTNPDPLVPPSSSYDGTLEEEFEQIVTSGRGSQMGATITMMLTGRFPASDDEICDAVAAAKVNLEKYAIVGFVEDLPHFAANVSALIGEPVTIPVQNKTDKGFVGGERNRYLTIKAFLSSQRVQAIVSQLCAPDRDVYTFARDLTRRTVTER